MKKWIQLTLLVIVACVLGACTGLDIFADEDTKDEAEEVTPIDELEHIEHFQDGALAHILEGELNRKGQAVGFHYEALPTANGEIVADSKTDEDHNGVYEAKVIISDVEKTSNGGKSSFFPIDWDTQDVVDAMNEAYDNRTFISGNTYEGITEEGIIIHMYLDKSDKIISAFPVY